jgi:hypothetical protein
MGRQAKPSTSNDRRHEAEAVAHVRTAAPGVNRRRSAGAPPAEFAAAGRTGASGGEHTGMPHLPIHGSAGGLGLLGVRRAPTIEPEQFERHLLRRTVGILSGDRTTCADCGRTPLVGEQLHLYDADVVVCELCRPLRAEQPISSVSVRHSEYGQTVRVTRTA